MRTIALPVIVLLMTLLGCSEARPKPPSVAELTTMLGSDDVAVQQEALAWIMELGPKASDTVPALIASLKSPHTTVRQSAAAALGKIGAGADTVVPALAVAVSDSEPSVRKAAAHSLGEFGPLAASAIPALETLSKKDNPCDPGPSALKKIRP